MASLRSAEKVYAFSIPDTIEDTTQIQLTPITLSNNSIEPATIDTSDGELVTWKTIRRLSTSGLALCAAGIIYSKNNGPYESFPAEWIITPGIFMFAGGVTAATDRAATWAENKLKCSAKRIGNIITRHQSLRS